MAAVAAERRPGDWESWRGGERQGVSTLESEPLCWTATENLAWSTRIPGNGHSSPVVLGDQVFVTTAYPSRISEQWSHLLSLASLLLAGVVVGFCGARLTLENSQTTGWTGGGLAWVGQVCAALALALLLFFLVFAPSALCYERCTIRGWLGSSLLVSTCAVVVQYRASPGRWRALVLGLGLIAFGAGVLWGVPAKSHAFRGGLQAPNSTIVLAIALVPIVLGLATLVNGLASRLPSAVTLRGLAACQGAASGIVVALAIYGALIIPRMRLGPLESIGVALASGLGGFLVLAWAVSWHPALAGSQQRVAPGAVAGRMAALGLVVASFILLAGWLLTEIVRRSPYLSLQLGNPRWTPQWGWASLGWCCLLAVAAWWFALRLEKARPRWPEATSTLALGLLACTVFVNVNYVAPRKSLLRAVVCLNAKTGAIRWTCAGLAGPEHLLHRDNSPATPTPLATPTGVYAYFGAAGVLCCDLEGRLRWTNREVQFDGIYGAATSPLVHDGILLIWNGGATHPRLHALDAETGRSLWECPFASSDRVSGVSRPPVVLDNRPGEVCVWSVEGLAGIDLNTGRPRWRHPLGGGHGDMVASMLVDGNRLICAAKDRVWALDTTAFDSLRNPVLWDTPGGPNCASPVLAGSLIFMVSDQGVATGMDAETGRICWRRRLPGEYYASPVVVGDCVYFCSTSGETTVLRVARRPEIVATNNHAEPTSASFAPCTHGLIVRTLERVFCVPWRKATASIPQSASPPETNDSQRGDENEQAAVAESALSAGSPTQR